MHGRSLGYVPDWPILNICLQNKDISSCGCVKEESDSPSSRIALSPKTMTSKSPSPWRRVRIWRLGRLLALTSSAQTPILPRESLSEVMLSFLEEPAVLSLLPVDMERGLVDLGALFGRADSGVSDLLFGTKD